MWFMCRLCGKDVERSRATLGCSVFCEACMEREENFEQQELNGSLQKEVSSKIMGAPDFADFQPTPDLDEGHRLRP